MPCGPLIQTHEDFAIFITELVLALFDGDQLRGLQGQLQPFRGLALTVRRAVLTQMRCVADVASSLPSDAYSPRSSHRDRPTGHKGKLREEYQPVPILKDFLTALQITSEARPTSSSSGNTPGGVISCG